MWGHILDAVCLSDHLIKEKYCEKVPEGDRDDSDTQMFLERLGKLNQHSLQKRRL